MSVYLKHFGLKKEPFSIVPDSKFLYPSYRHRQAVAHLKYGLDREGGFIVLTGEVGTGKTTLTKTLIEHLPPNVRVGYILNSKLKESDLFASICKELSIRFRRNSNLSFSKQCTDAIYDDLLETHSQGLKTLIVIEEAQNLDDEILESLRLLSNLETSSNKLLHILLVGQPELIRKLEQNNLRQLNQRVVSRFHLLPLQNNEVKDYITYRLKQGGTNRELFGNRACKQIYRLTKGVPRLINLICHQALLGMYSENKHTASTELIREACKEALGAQITETTNKWLVNLSLLLASLIVLIALTAVLPACAQLQFGAELAKQGKRTAAGGIYKVGKPYKIAGEWYYPRENTKYDNIGIASWYGPKFQGRRTSLYFKEWFRL